MAQIKVYGVKDHLLPRREVLSKVIHTCVMEALGMPRDKRAQRFIPMERENFFMPGGRTDDYTIIEVSLISGRTKDTKKKLIRLLFDRIKEQIGIDHQDLEICISEHPPENWGFRGFHGDEIRLNYKIDV